LRKGKWWSKIILKNQIPITLHANTLDVPALLGCGLPDRVAVLVDDDLAVGLHDELGGAVGGDELVVDVEPEGVGAGWSILGRYNASSGSYIRAWNIARTVGVNVKVDVAAGKYCDNKE
jgi:hypothetical protein